MSDRYRPSGPRSSRYGDEHDWDRNWREQDGDRNRDSRGRGNTSTYKSQFSNSNSREPSGRDYYSSQPGPGNKHYKPGRSGDGPSEYDDKSDRRNGPHTSSSSSLSTSSSSTANRGNRNSGPGRGGYKGASNGHQSRDSSAAPPPPPSSSANATAPDDHSKHTDIKFPSGPKQSRPVGNTTRPSGPSGNPPVGPKGAPIPTGPSKGRPSGPSGYRNNAQSEDAGRDTYRPPQKSGRSALPPQESTINGSKRPHPSDKSYKDSYRDDDDGGYRKRHHYQDDYDYDHDYSSSGKGYRSGYSNGSGSYGKGYSNDSYSSGPKGKGTKPPPPGKQRPGPPPPKAKKGVNGVNNKETGPGGHKKATTPRRTLANSQIYSIKTTKTYAAYARVQQVGEGTYGKVYKAKNSVTNEFVALKKLRLESEREGFPITAMREIKLLQSFNHPNVIGLLEMMIEQSQIYMIFDYMDHDLTGLLTHPDLQLEEAHKKFIFKQLMEGINYLHKKRVIHRDIKGSNILLDNLGSVKIADFGLARTMKNIQNGESPDYTNRVITIWYRPPELLLGSTDYGREVDIWGVGCLLIELYSKLAIFQGFDEVGQLQKIFNIMGTPTMESWPTMDELPWFEMLKPKVNKAAIFEAEYRPKMSELSFDLASKLLKLDPKMRLTASEALEHPYFSEEPQPEPLYFLKELKGEWHEFETKKRRRRERKRIQELKDQEASVAE